MGKSIESNKHVLPKSEKWASAEVVENPRRGKKKKILRGRKKKMGFPQRTNAK